MQNILILEHLTRQVLKKNFIDVNYYDIILLIQNTSSEIDLNSKIFDFK